ncbi:MAG: FAD-dependent oxidoreductase [Clostridium perfringens]|nr:FAD-dependent oxidoreductase [Clostridium perfringens]
MSFFKSFFENTLRTKDKCLSYVKNNKKIEEFIENFKNNIEKFKSYKYIKKLNKKRILIPFCIISVFFIGNFVGDVTHREDVFIKRIERALERGKTGTILNLIKVENGVNLTKNDIKPLIEFYKDDSTRVKTLIDALRKGNSAYSLELCIDENSIFNKYYLELKLQDMEIMSNFKGSYVYVNGVDKGTIGEDGSLEVNNMVPGIYNIEIEKESDYGTIKEESEVTLVESSNFHIPIQGNLVTVNSNFEEGIVYINGNSSNIKVKDFIDIGPFDQNNSTTLMVKADTPWGTLSSNEFTIGSYPVIELNIDLKNNKVIDEINDLVNRFYFSVFKALNSESKSDIVSATGDVKDNVYSILNKEYFWFKNSYEVSDLEIKINNSEINFDGNNYTGNIVVNVSYKIKKQIFGISFKTEEYSKNFFTEIKYENSNWIVCGINNFSLEGLENAQ